MDKSLFEGELVRLTVFNVEADVKTMAAWWRDSEFSRLLDSEPARPWSAPQVKKEFEEEKLEHNQFPFAIRTLADDKLIGFVGLFGVSWKHNDAWVGIGIGDRAYWGRGYGTDAMRLALRYGFTELNLHRITLGVFAYNPRAIRSYEKAGFRIEGRLRQELYREGQRWDGIYMGILREEWLALQPGGSS